MGHYFVRYKREFVITVIVITEFDCMYIYLTLTYLTYPASQRKNGTKFERFSSIEEVWTTNNPTLHKLTLPN